MTVKPKLACGLQECVGELWNEGFLTDFTVVVEGREFQCHRFILSACSGFFKGLMASQMKESVGNCANIEGMSVGTFEVILKSVYTGFDGLTEDNVIDVWYAVDQLQIQYLIKECEDFIIENLKKENIMEIYHHAHVLDSTGVLSASHKFMLQKFDEIRSMDSFLDLPLEDILMLVESYDLNVSSEDDVAEFILQWVSHVPDSANKSKDEDPDCASSDDIRQKSTGEKGAKKEVSGVKTVKQKENERQNHLANLLSTCRLCLVSSRCLEKLLKNPMVRSGSETLDVVQDALFYQFETERREGQWPSVAIHRASSAMEHVMIFIGGNNCEIKAYNLTDKTFHVVGVLPAGVNPYNNMSIIGHDNVLYMEESITENHRCTGIFKHFTSDRKWVPDIIVNDYPLNHDSHILAYGNSIIRCNKRLRCLEEYDFNKSNSHQWLKNYPTVQTYGVTSLAKFKNLILMFEKTLDRPPQTNVYCVDTETLQKTSHSTIAGRPDNIVSFTDNKDSYILQRNGTLRMMSSPKPGFVEFHEVDNLWDFDWKIYGAVSFKKQLFIFGEEAEKRLKGKTWKSSVDGVFPDVQIVKIESRTRCMPMVVPKSWLT